VASGDGLLGVDAGFCNRFVEFVELETGDKASLPGAVGGGRDGA
jgi:hypothetical protein